MLKLNSIITTCEIITNES